MAIQMIQLSTREEWLKHRSKFIGGSDCASIVGENPWKSNTDLWLEKTGQKEPSDISDTPNVKFGIDAEPIIRELFKLNYPQYEVLYVENNSWINDKYPFAAVSHDGWLIDSNGRNGIWECKTSEIVSSMAKEKWKDKIPTNYYCQLLHSLMVREDCEFAVLTALLTWRYDDKEVYQQLKNYHIERADVLEDIKYLTDAEAKFWNQVQTKNKTIIDITKYLRKEELMELEFKVNEYQLPDKLIFNYDELKQELSEKVEMYKSLVYSDDQIKEAKADRASLNKLKAALNDERIRREREYMKPFKEFKEKVDEIIKIIDAPIAMIDTQVKGYEEKKKEEKLEEIKNFFNSTLHHEWVKLQMIFDDKWLNASCSMKSIQTAIDTRLEQIENDLKTIENLPDFAFEAVEVYKSTLDINKAISEAQRMVQIAKAKAEAEAKKAEYEATQAAKLAEQMANKEVETISEPKTDAVEAITPKKNWVKLAAHMTLEEARLLKKFFDDHCIEFKAI